MARAGASYTALNGSKIEYATTETGTYSVIPGIKTIPAIGGTPATIDTTDLDNTEYETAILGLKPIQQYDFLFNLETPDAEANIKLASDMEDSGEEYFFKLTYASGIVVSFKSKVRTTLEGGSSQDLETFTMHLSPIGEPVRTIPTTPSL